MDLLPALTIHPSTPLSQALELSYEREYSYLPVVSTSTKRLLGYLTADLLRQAAGTSSPDALVADHYIKFSSKATSSSSSNTSSSKKREFLKITPETPLEQLEQFFKQGQEFAVVTDDERRFVLGVAVKEDLDKFVKSRPSLKV